MATKKQNKPVKRAEWKGYHKVNLTREDDALFGSAYVTKDVPWSDIDILINQGYKFSIAWDDYNQGVTASLYAQSQKMEWAGYTLTAWAGDVETATKLLLFKHYVVCREQWEIAKPEREGSNVKWG